MLIDGPGVFKWQRTTLLPRKEELVAQLILRQLRHLMCSRRPSRWAALPLLICISCSRVVSGDQLEMLVSLKEPNNLGNPVVTYQAPLISVEPEQGPFPDKMCLHIMHF